MNDPQKPRFLHNKLTGNVKGSFAEKTITQRLPTIAKQILSEPKLTAQASVSIKILMASIPHGLIQQLSDINTPDYEAWQAYILPHENKSWLQAPWFFSENYFYRRIVASVSYFQSQFDPFNSQKNKALNACVDRASKLLDFPVSEKQSVWDSLVFRNLVIASLWGNQADLSLSIKSSHSESVLFPVTPSTKNIIINDIEILSNVVQQKKAMCVHLITDNVGLELFCDLVLLDYLLLTGKATEVCLHVKQHPTFVSDVIEADLYESIKVIMNSPSMSCRQFAERLSVYLKIGRLKIKPNFFWNSPLLMWEMPSDLFHCLMGSDLTICKGDANYRRAFGDIDWPIDSKPDNIIDYFPSPLLVLRTCKSEVTVGLSLKSVKHLNQVDPSWRTNGQWGIIQYIGF